MSSPSDSPKLQVEALLFSSGKSMTAEQIAYWEGILSGLSQDEEWKKLLARNYWEPAYMTSAEMKRYYDEEHAKLKAVLGELGLLK